MTRSDIEEQIGVALADHAGDDVHVEQLLAGATTRGRAIRGRRLALGAGAAVAAVVTLAVGVVNIVPAPWRSDVVVPQPAAMTTQVPAAPVLEDRPVRPGEVGTNPLRLHWRFDRIPKLPIRTVHWANQAGGYESADLFTGQGALLGSVTLTQRGFENGPPMLPADSKGDLYDLTNEEAVTVSGEPAKLLTYSRDGQVRLRMLAWTVMPGTYGYVGASAELPRDTIRGLAEAVRTDRVSRCAVPFRLTRLPAAMAVTECSMSLSVGGGPATGTIDIVSTRASGNVRIVPWRGGEGRPQQKIAHATPSPDVPPASSDDANRQVNGRPALWTFHDRTGPEDGGQLILFAAEDLIVEFYTWGGQGEDDALSMAAGYQPAQGNDPTTWPLDPLG